ncbi:MAG TPA: ubiquinol-cytochrome c reductase iron-sulfur subunit [Verrucomicrobiae bacterium]|nr:ubiquinol-cytochrome c reductase iron-sulfur subunit [Verrucomicrobiae bacterium]
MNENNLPPSPSHEVSRRRFFERLSLVLSGVAGAGLAAPVVGFIVGPLFRRVQLVWRPVGEVDSFKVGETVAVRFEAPSPETWAGVSARTAAWLRRETDTRFTAFAINCTHLGCPVRWLPQAELFMCPCHGGVYYRDGTVAAGPPPRPLVRYPVRLVGTEVQVQAGPIPIT